MAPRVVVLKSKRPSTAGSSAIPAVIDQVLISAGSLITSVVIGRAAGPEILGQYTLGFSLAVIASCLLRALVVGPFGVFVYRTLPDQIPVMRGALLLQVAACLAVTSLTGVGITCLFAAVIPMLEWNSAGEFSSVLGIGLAVVLATTGSMAREAARQASFAEMKFRGALLTDAMSMLLQLSGLVWAWQTDRLTAMWLLAVLGVATWSATLVWLMSFIRGCRFESGEAGRRWPATWRFGRWEAMGQTCQVLSGYALSWILAITGGFAAAGVYAATWTVIQLISPLAQGAGNAMSPALSRGFAKGGLPALRSMTRQITVAAISIGTVYVVIMATAGPLILETAFGSQYGRPTALMTVLAIAMASSLGTMAMMKSIAILERPHANFWIQAGVLAAIVVFAFTLGWMAGPANGLIAAAIGLMIANVSGGLAKWICYRRIVWAVDAYSSFD